MTGPLWVVKRVSPKAGRRDRQRDKQRAAAMDTMRELSREPLLEPKWVLERVLSKAERREKQRDN